MHQDIKYLIEQLISERAGLVCDSSLTSALQRLDGEDCIIVVCGEVKRGKSTFINALLGQCLLPVGVQETTSQVYRISSSEEERFKLVFDDQHTEAITRKELSRYGSQTDYELQGMPIFRGRSLKWIDVEIPAVFLREGIHLVDTPGLGALYASHSEITRKYIVNADAVIFVLDSNQPLTQSDKLFLDQCFSVTPNVLFVQAKVDTKGEEEWRSILKRNEELLNASWPRENRVPIRVYPISSKLLAEAAGEEDEEEKKFLVEDSFFENVQAALEILIERTVGWTRKAWAAAECRRYLDRMLRTLEEQLKMLQAESAEEKLKLNREKQRIRSEFQELWGPSGTKRKVFHTEMDKVFKGVRGAAQYIGSTGSELQKSLSGQIDALKTREALEQFANQLPEKVQNGANQEWQSIILGAQSRISELDSELNMNPEGQLAIRVNLPQVVLREPSLWDRVKSVNIDAMVGGSLAALVAGTFLTGGLATFVTLAGAGIAARKGYEKIMHQQIEAARNELRTQLNNLLAQSRNSLCAPDMGRGQTSSQVDAFIETTHDQINRHLEEQYREHRERLVRDEKSLEEQSHLTGEERADETKRVQEQLVTLKELSAQTNLWIEDLREMQAELDRAESAIGKG